jgi:ribosomal protein S18 acetylase RimI-like enzyme
MVQSQDRAIVLAIAEACAPDNTWDRTKFLKNLQHQSVVPIIVEDWRDDVVGFMLYQLEPDCIRLLEIGVDPEYRREGFGTALVEFIQQKSRLRGRIEAHVSDDQLELHLFLRACKFQAKPHRWPGERYASEYLFVYQANRSPPA